MYDCCVASKMNICAKNCQELCYKVHKTIRTRSLDNGAQDSAFGFITDN
jgi:hypothetical protein